MVSAVTTSLRFGTSGLRGIAAELGGREARRYTTAFLHYLMSIGESTTEVHLGRDLRSSSKGIFLGLRCSCGQFGRTGGRSGRTAHACLSLSCHSSAPSIMITGSHIPADRNGLKFFRADREIDDGTMVHYRASGNAPELRCYVEADAQGQAQNLLQWGVTPQRWRSHETGAVRAPFLSIDM